jgi:hypothetical protein
VCASADISPVCKYPVFWEYLNSIYITTVLNIPPQKLISIAVAPLVTPAKSAFIRLIASAGTSPMVEAANIVAIFEKPALTPTGINAEAGIRLSRYDSTTATAESIPNNAIL